MQHAYLGFVQDGVHDRRGVVKKRDSVENRPAAAATAEEHVRE